MKSEIEKLRDTVEELELSSLLFDQSMRRGTEYYHAKHPENKRVWPDYGELACWLMEEIVALETTARVRENEMRLIKEWFEKHDANMEIHNGSVFLFSGV